MGRREFIALVGGAAAWPLIARAQQGERLRLIGVLQPRPDGDAEARRQLAAFEQELQRLGWINGGNLRIEYRWAGEDLRGYVVLQRNWWRSNPT